MIANKTRVFLGAGAIARALPASVFFAVAIAATCGAADFHWTGAAGDNDYTNALNWAESSVPGSGGTAIFNNAEVLNLHIRQADGEYRGVANFRFLGKDVFIDGNTFYMYGTGTPVIEVVAGTTVTCSNYLYMYNSVHEALAKSGGGTFRYAYTGHIGGLKKIVVEGGRFEGIPNSATSYTIPSNVGISARDGGDFSLSVYNSIASSGGTLSLDGGTFSVGMSGVQYWWMIGSDSARTPNIEVGADGGTFRVKDYGDYYSDNGKVRAYGTFVTASDVVNDGGVTIDLRPTGVGFMPLEPFSLNGPVTVMDGKLMMSRYGDSEYPDLASHPSFLGTGDFMLDCSLLDYLDTNGNLAEGTLRLASGAGSVMRVRGSSEIRFRATTSKNVQHVVVGADGAAADSAFVRERGGALFLHDAGQAFDGEKSTFKVNGGVATNALSTLVKAPVFTEDATIASAGDVYPLCYDAEKGFVKFTDFATDLTAGENKVVRPASALAENATAHVAAIQLVNWGYMTLNAGSRLTIGNGIDPAFVMLGYETDIGGSGTIDFGTSEGVVAVGPCGADDYGHSVSVSFSGSGGMSYVSRPNFSRRVVTLKGPSDYTGDTHISVAAIRVQNSLAFSSGDVYVEGGYRNGGKLIFDTPLTIENNLHVSGGGHRLHQWREATDIPGAISFETNGVTIAGTVELTANAEVASSGEGTFAGTISGDRLVVRPGEGRIVLAANNTYTGGTEIEDATVVLGGESPSLGTGRVTLDNGVLRFENTSPITFSNALEGVGRIEVAGADVTFASPQLAALRRKKLPAGSYFEYPSLELHVPQRGMQIIFR